MTEAAQHRPTGLDAEAASAALYAARVAGLSPEAWIDRAVLAHSGQAGEAGGGQVSVPADPLVAIPEQVKAAERAAAAAGIPVERWLSRAILVNAPGMSAASPAAAVAPAPTSQAPPPAATPAPPAAVEEPAVEPPAPLPDSDAAAPASVPEDAAAGADMVAPRLAQIVESAREDMAAQEPFGAEIGGGGLEVRPEDRLRPPGRRKATASWLTALVLLLLALVAGAVWLAPRLAELGLQVASGTDFALKPPAERRQAKPPPAAEKEPAAKTPTAAKTPEVGGEEPPQPPAAHVDWYLDAAQKGVVDAQKTLAQLYLRGEGVEKNHAEAARWLRAVADGAGDPEAQFSLGVLSQRGLGVAKDPAKALHWFQKAGEQGHLHALYNAGYILARGTGVPKDYTKAHAFFLRAAEKGLARAQFNLGLLYERGLGIPQDKVVAFKWYVLARAGGETVADKALDSLTPQMTEPQIDKAIDLIAEYTGR